ncbi:helix-turn-helix domain-containing protein [Sphingobacterium sp.]|uniref:helix-turn-helix domain-containing protein n=1 Tax=Sphingobacterium sp. TaxID=341027 RepID=UPI002FD9A67C
MINTGNKNEFQNAFSASFSYYFDNFGNEEQFFDSAKRWIDDKYFLIVFGCSNKDHRGQHTLLFFSNQYFPVQELRGYFKEGAYFAFRSDLFTGYSLRNKLKEFGFLEYSIQESMILSNNDYRLIKNIFELIDLETKMPMSETQSKILISYLDLLLQHMQRFYQQLMEDKLKEFSALQKDFMSELHTLFDSKRKCLSLLPSLTLLSTKLNCTTRFLNDVSLKTSKNTAQYHIDNFIVKIAKELLAETHLSVAEIAKNMQFDQPQSLTRLFKKKTKISPLDYRISII